MSRLFHWDFGGIFYAITTYTPLLLQEQQALVPLLAHLSVYCALESCLPVPRT
jgi:hypothetical protein